MEKLKQALELLKKTNKQVIDFLISDTCDDATHFRFTLKAKVSIEKLPYCLIQRCVLGLDNTLTGCYLVRKSDVDNFYNNYKTIVELLN